MTPGQTRRSKPKAFAIVGGGRWARVFISVLSTLDLPYQLIVVSRSNVEQLTAIQNKNGCNFSVVPALDDLIERYDIVAALVVNAARFHYETASRLVECGVTILIEKPVALVMKDVDRLYASAAKSGTYVMPALSYLHCSYLHNFARRVQEHGEPVHAAHIVWSDPSAEIRYGEGKSFDPGISVAQDVMPHIWSILACVLGFRGEQIDARSCVAERGGRKALFEFTFMGTPVRVEIEREASERRRYLEIEFSAGQKLTIDFSVEPGTIKAGSDTFCGDPDWDRTARPVRRQLQSFLALLDQAAGQDLLYPASIGSVSLIESSDALLKQQQGLWLGEQPVTSVNDDVTYAVCEIAGPHFYRMNKIQSGDRKALLDHIEVVMRQLTKSYSPAGMDWMSALRTLC